MIGGGKAEAILRLSLRLEASMLRTSRGECNGGASWFGVWGWRDPCGAFWLEEPFGPLAARGLV